MPEYHNKAKISVIMKNLTLAILLLALFAVTVQAAEQPDMEAIGQAIRSIESGTDPDLARTIRVLEEAEKSVPYIRDYLLFHKARAYMARGMNNEAFDTTSYMLRKYPGSPIKQKVLALQIDISLTKGRDSVLPAFESYIKSFPGDQDVRMLHAETLAGMGMNENSQAAYRKVYLSAGPRSPEAYELLENKELNDDERLTISRALVEEHKYPEAEQHLAPLMKNREHENSDEILKLYARTLFRQKKYVEVAPYLEELGYRFDLARAYIRSGDRESFHRTVLTMVARNDKDAPRLLIALADEARRDGSPKKALEYLDDALALFPDAREEAEWSKAWLYYRSEKFDKAERILRHMRRKYKNDKYAYWAARSRQRMGGDAMPLLRKVNGTGYYSLLASLRLGNGLTQDLVTVKHAHHSSRLRRADLLLAAGLAEDARIELEAIASKTRRYRELLDIARRMIKAEDYHQAQKLMIRVPESKRPDDVLYPLAYWSEVSEAAISNGLDPLLMLSLMREESRFDPDAFSPAGAMGLMQLMPDTAHKHVKGSDHVLTSTEDLFDPGVNVSIGSIYFNRLVQEFGSVAPSIAAYNAGERTVRKWLAANSYDSYDEFVEDIPYKETRDYVKRIMRSYERYISTRGALNSPQGGLNLL